MLTVSLSDDKIKKVKLEGYYPSDLPWLTQGVDM